MNSDGQSKRSERGKGGACKGDFQEDEDDKDAEEEEELVSRRVPSSDGSLEEFEIHEDDGDKTNVEEDDDNDDEDDEVNNITALPSIRRVPSDESLQLEELDDDESGSGPSQIKHHSVRSVRQEQIEEDVGALEEIVIDEHQAPTRPWAGAFKAKRSTEKKQPGPRDKQAAQGRIVIGTALLFTDPNDYPPACDACLGSSWDFKTCFSKGHVVRFTDGAIPKKCEDCK